jgi:hypothetical protein
MVTKNEVGQKDGIGWVFLYFFGGFFKFFLLVGY